MKPLILYQIFSERTSLSHRHCQCLFSQTHDEDFGIYAGVVNCEWEKVKVNKISPDIFKCLIFEEMLTLRKDAETRSGILTKHGKNPKLTLQTVAEKCQRILN